MYEVRRVEGRHKMQESNAAGQQAYQEAALMHTYHPQGGRQRVTVRSLVADSRETARFARRGQPTHEAERGAPEHWLCHTEKGRLCFSTRMVGVHGI
jgi:hypothetical protein